MKPGPFLIIRNTFPTTFKHFLHSTILKSENTKTLLFIAYTYKKPQKYRPSSLLSSLHYYLPPLHIYLLFCIHYYLNIILTPCALQPLGEVEGTKQSTLFAGNLVKDKKIKSPLLIPWEFDIKPSSHPRGKKLPLLHTLHLEAQPIPYIFSFQCIKSACWRSWGRRTLS